MSAGVSDQRMKGQGNQVSNVPKEHLESGGEDFEQWRHQPTAAASHTPYVPISTATDPYSAAGYYGSAAGTAFPYQAFGVSDGTWSNGTDPMTFLGGYTHDSYGVDAFGQPSTFNYFHGNGDYSTWGTHNQQRKAHYEDYYRPDAQAQSMYTAQNPNLGMPETGLSLKTVEQGMQNLGLDMATSLHASGQMLPPAMAQMATSNLGSGQKEKDSGGLKNPDGSMGQKDNLGLNQGQQTSIPKKMTWASIASQPAKPQVSAPSTGLKKKGPGMPPPPMIPGKHNMDIGTWDTSKNGPSVPQTVQTATAPKPQQPQQQNVVTQPLNVRPSWPAPVRPQPQVMAPRPTINVNQNISQSQNHNNMMANHNFNSQQVMMPHIAPASGMGMQPHAAMVAPQLGAAPPALGIPAGQMMMAPALPMASHPVLDELRGKNNYNPPEFDLTAPNARFFVIKSYSEDDIHRSIKYEIWCSTEHGNKRLDQAYREREKEGNGGTVYLFFSVNGSGHFCGMAQMVSPVDYNSNSSVWSQNKWKGQFRVRWIYVKDVPNVQLRHIRLENNENKPVTNSRDTQEVPHPKGQQVLRILHSYRHNTSIFDDFIHYEKRQEEEDSRKGPPQSESGGYKENHATHSNHANQATNYHGENKGHGDYENKGHSHGNYKSQGNIRDHQSSGGGGGGGGYRDRGAHEGHGGSGYENHRHDNRDNFREGRGVSHREPGGHDGHRPHHNVHHKDRGEPGTRGRGRGRN